MRAVLVCLAVLVSLTILALTPPAGAQMSQQMMEGIKHDMSNGTPQKKEAPQPRANEKDYKASLEKLPDKKYDPWAKSR